MQKLLLQFKNNLNSHMAQSWMPMLVILVIVGAFLFLAYQFAINKNFSPDSLIRDPDYVSNMPFYIGSISMLGVILWSVAAAFCFMGTILLNKKSRKFWFLMSAGVFTTLLGLDDAFEFHQVLFPKYFHISEVVVYLVYMIYTMSFLFFFIQDIFNETDFPILGASLLCMIISIFPAHFFDLNFIEDSFKFLGIAFWLTYFSRTSIIFVNEHFHKV